MPIKVFRVCRYSLTYQFSTNPLFGTRIQLTGSGVPEYEDRKRTSGSWNLTSGRSLITMYVQRQLTVYLYGFIT